MPPQALTAIDFDQPADLFWSASARRHVGKGQLRFRSFPSLSLALDFLREKGPQSYFSCAIDSGERRFEKDDVVKLLASTDEGAAER